jgi:hydrogenase maturation protease
MNTALVEKVVNAVLYEGYILYPYRASSKKNRERFTFGRVYPEDYSIAQHGAEPSAMQTECLLRNESKDALVTISLRFLHPMAREVGMLRAPIAEMPNEGAPDFAVVPDFRVGEQLYQTWQEVVERKVEVPTFPLREAWQTASEFAFPSSRVLEPIRSEDGRINALLVRRQDAVRGTIEIMAQPIDRAVFKITVRVLNRTRVPPNDLENQSAIIMRTFTSTHTILHTQGGEWLSLTDPPAAYAEATAACKNTGTWPVLVGDQAKNERDTMLSSPIILYDYPQIAPESPGDLFDGLEIDEILTLRVMAMSDAEKVEMRQVDEQARRILERTENMSSDHLLKMHGVMRSVRSSNEDFFNPSTRLESATVGDVQVKAGDRVRIRPKKRADVMDMALDGKIAVIEAVEQDLEGGVQLALVLDDDPGRDLGMLRQPGHRFFYATDEVEPVKNYDE